MRLPLLLCLLLSGCLAGPAADEPAEARTTFEYADEEGLQRVDSLHGLRPTGDGGWTWSALNGMEADQSRLLLAQALVDLEFEVKTDYDVQAEPSSPLGERPDVNGVCVLHGAWEKVTGDGFIARAMGDLDAVVDQQGGGSFGDSFGSGAGGGTGGGFATMDLNQGDWVLLQAGLSGYEPGLAATDGGRIEFSIDVPGPFRFVEIEPAALICAAGFARLEGGTLSQTRTQLGGSLSSFARYGAKFWFCPGLDLTSISPTNQATVDFLGEEFPLGNGPGRVLEDPRAGNMTLRVDSWLGQPWWGMDGLGWGMGSATFFC